MRTTLMCNVHGRHDLQINTSETNEPIFPLSSRDSLAIAFNVNPYLYKSKSTLFVIIYMSLLFFALIHRGVSLSIPTRSKSVARIADHLISV